LDNRRRRDAVKKMVLGFNGQMEAMTDAFIEWGQYQGDLGTMDAAPVAPDPEEIENYYRLNVVDIFSKCLELLQSNLAEKL
jgi:hypothetical protein